MSVNKKRFDLNPLGDSAITLDFREGPDPQVNDLVLEISRILTSNPFTGFIESLPAYSSVTVFYEPLKVDLQDNNNEPAFSVVARYLRSLLENLGPVNIQKPDIREIEVDFSKEFAPDLDFVADFNGLRPEQVIDLFLASTYRVFMLGFLPGFPYMGTLDKRIAAPRLDTPRLKVPKGSVGIAGRQTGVYPLESPGGWRLIGRTKTELFRPDRDEPALLSPGDEVKFVEIV